MATLEEDKKEGWLVRPSWQDERDGTDCKWPDEDDEEFGRNLVLPGSHSVLLPTNFVVVVATPPRTWCWLDVNVMEGLSRMLV